MVLCSFALLLTMMNGSVAQSNADLGSGVALVRLFNTLENNEKPAGGYKTAQELQRSGFFDSFMNRSPSSSVSDMMKNINRQDLSNPLPGWTIRVYTSPDRQHYLIRAQSTDGLAVYSDERGLIQTGSPLH